MMTSDNESPSSHASTLSSISWHSNPSSTSGTSRRTQNVLLAALTSVLFLTVIQLTRLSQVPTYTEPDTPAYMESDIQLSARKLRFTPLHQVSEDSVADTPPALQSNATVTSPPRPKRYAVANFVDSEKYLWGIYSIHTQMKKLNMSPAIAQVVLVASGMKSKHKDLLREWLGDENVLEVDEKFVRDHVPGGVWSVVFSKIEFFNLTQFDKVIGLDNDIFIRQNIAHWFDYPAPAATQARGTLEWNSGAMVLEPNEDLYHKLLEYVPKIRAWDKKKDKGVDNFNSGHGHQGFISSFFLSNITNDTMYTMGYGASVLSSDLRRVDKNEYFWKYRNEAIETIHFTVDKPWKGKTAATQPILCAAFEEWLESIADAPKEKLKKLPNILRKCTKEVSEKPAAQEAAAPTSNKEAKAAAKQRKDEEKHKKALKRHRKALEAMKRRKKAALKGDVEELAGSSDICFVSSVYGSTPEISNAPPDVSELLQDSFPDSKFYLFTNMDGLDAPGWTKIVRRFDYARFETQSRLPKFMAWKEPFIQDCRVVFYMDESMRPKGHKASDLLEIADEINRSQSGLAQNPAPRKENHTLLAEMKYILRTEKDSHPNVQAAIQWFQEQPDFEERIHSTIYDTGVLGYDPKNTLFQEAATFFWDHYSKEKDTVVDQALWAYTLNKFGLHPGFLGGKNREYFVKLGNNLAHEDSVGGVAVY